MSINLTDEIEVKTKKGKLGAAKQIFLEGDTQTVEKEIQDINSRHNSLNTKHESLSKTVQGIAATGGASTATNVTYNNDASRLNAENAQDAIDELQSSKIDKISILQESGEAEYKVMSQKAVKMELDKKIDKVSIAQEFGDSENKVVSQFALPFREIESPEFINAIVDAEGYFIFGIQLDGSIEWSKGIPAPIRAKLQEIINQCQQDKTNILEAINADKRELSALQETKVDKEEGKSLIDADVADAHYTLEDPEGRTEITTDAENKVMSYRDSSGKKHEHDMEITNLEVSNLNLKGNSVNNIGDALKANDFKLDSPSDFSNDSYVELPIPRIAAQVRIYAPKLPTTKQDDIEAEIEYNDKDGNYFRKPVILNAQGSSSMSYYVKNMAIDISDGSEIKFGDFPTQDSFHLKKYYIDAFRGQCIVGYWLMEQVYKSRPLGQQYPYEYSYSNESTTDGLGDVKKDFFNGAKCHPDGFPIIITWINSKTNEETWMGIYAWNLKKSKEVYNCEKKKVENIILDGTLGTDTFFNGTIDWTAFEIRNPKNLIDINGNKYDGDNPKELSETDTNSKKVKDAIVRLSRAKSDLATSNTKETFEKYFLVNPFIDYYLTSEVVFHFDGLRKNWIWLTLNAQKWTPTIYDMDSIFASFWNGTYVIPNSENLSIKTYGDIFGLDTLYKEEIEKRYSELRASGIFSVNNIVSLLHKWIVAVGYDNYVKEFKVFNETPSYRNSNLSDSWKLDGFSPVSGEKYDNNKTYAINESCNFNGYVFVSLEEQQGVPPVSKIYDKNPTVLGFYNSEKRVYNWLVKRFIYLDKLFNYKY